MTGFHRDDDGDWVAELSCLHQQHVRHAPPFSEVTWIDDEVEVGQVRFVAATDPVTDVLVTPSRPQPIPPEVDHHVVPGDGARFHVTFLTR